jgi:TRAP transporter TAXI family solute receptor
MQKKSLILSWIVVVLLFATCSSEAAPAVNNVEFISIGTAQLGGGTYNNCLAMASAANMSLTKYRVEALPTSGAVESARMLQDNEVEIVSIGIDTAFDLYNGKGRYENKRWTALRMMFPQFGTYVNIIVPKNSSINSWNDMRGKRIGVGNPGSNGYYLLTHMLRAHGLKEGDYTEVALSNTEQAIALQDGHLDVFGFYTTPHSPAIVELSTILDVRWIDVEKSKWDAYAVEQQLPFKVVDIAAGTYKGMDKEIATVSGMNYIATREDCSEEMIYQFTKAFFENFDVAVKAVPAIAEIKELLPTAVPVVPVHPGAIKYFIEAGIAFNDFSE